jgi:hypothetical protein
MAPSSENFLAISSLTTALPCLGSGLGLGLGLTTALPCLGSGLGLGLGLTTALPCLGSGLGLGLGLATAYKVTTDDLTSSGSTYYRPARGRR